MIRYALSCDSGHSFESWFPSSTSYDEQARAGLVTCPFCDSPKVAKQIMAPSLGRATALPAPVEAPGAATSGPSAPGAAAPGVPVPAPSAPADGPVSLVSEPERQLRAMIRALHEHVARTADHVGEDFAAEARRMHYGETEQRAIYGEASLNEARSLLEEGIAVQPLPALPDDRN
ncbi:DUF1178 family protein [Methylobacterium platani]|uniref:Uncharacterized protein n=2 Tax=Methylobacterium platani TaxID=427683 RepID=A0A179S9R9_9HYPH|nr:DUF1178 family protein [Methylobacterium platani]KMO11971.1 hypothetical protein SQ03_25590 [Methylobacterium platani JCM 14648]OAS23367.1 hypothetical protein A5481_17025 [Methylobacterium platani]